MGGSRPTTSAAARIIMDLFMSALLRHTFRKGQPVLLLLTQIPVHSLDKHRGSPCAFVAAVTSVIVQRGLAGFHLLQRHSLLDHVFNAVANDDNHVTILEDVRFVADAAVAGDHISSAFL